MIPLFKVAMNTPQVMKDLEPVLNSGFVGQGPKVEEFEQKLGMYLKTPYDNLPLTMNSCTSALDMALHLIGRPWWGDPLNPGDIILSTPQTCLATNTVIHNRGLKIVWVDIDPLTGNMDPASLVRVARKYPNAKAVMVVDWAGRCSVTKELVIAAGGIPIIQDAAHSFMTEYNGKPLVECGANFICWSFQAIKHLTTGDGGALWCREPQDRERAKLLRWYGLDRTTGTAMRCTQELKEVGFKYQMNDIAATIGMANLGLAHENVMQHRANALELSKRIKNEKIAVPEFDWGSANWIFSVHVQGNRREEFTLYCKERGIDVSRVHVQNDTQRRLNAVHGESSYAQEWCNDGLKGVNSFSQTQVAIPCGWWLTKEDLDRIIEVVNAF